MLLAFDVGNTNIVMGVYKGHDLLQNWRLETDKLKTADEYGMVINQLFSYEGLSTKDVTDVIISTVVPSITYTLQHLSMKYFGTAPIVIGPGVKTGLIVKYDNPKQVGADRIVNAVAAVETYKAPVIVIDYGTATTFDAITDKCEYLGGCIAPGIKISSDALFEKTASLPRVELEVTGKSICKNTYESIQAGVIYSAVGTTEFIVNKMKEELKQHVDGDKEIVVIATGGMASMIAGELNCIQHVDKLLTLRGLELIFEKNRSSRSKRKVKDDIDAL